MRFIRCFTLLGLAAFSIAASNVTGTTMATEYEMRQFGGGPAWFVYDGPVDVALHVLKPDDPSCHEVGEIILLFENRDQLRDETLIEKAALAGMNRYAELCRSLGANPANQRKVAGFIVGEGEPDARGRVIGDARVLDAMVSSLTGTYRLTVRRNSVAAASADNGATATLAEGNRALTAHKAEREAASETGDKDRSADITAIRATYDAAVAESMANAKKPGLLERLSGGERTALTGVWSGSKPECSKERVILFERNGAGTVEWWRASHEEIGLLPWRTGRWDLRDGTIIMNFDHRVEYDRFLRDLRSGDIDETVQFDLKSVTGSELRLAATGGGISPEALFLGGAEKLFVQCGK